MQKLGSGISEQTELTNSNITMLISLVRIQVSRLRHLKTIESHLILSIRKMLKLNSILALKFLMNYSKTTPSSQ